jgi:toluene monooxygenase system protein D
MHRETVANINHVGPVLEACTAADAVIAAIEQLNMGVIVVNRGAYLRVLVPRRCIVTRAAIEEHLGRSFHLPGDLEKIMSAFKGILTMSEEEVVWAFKSGNKGKT